MILYLLTLVWIAGWLTAYPRNKKWRIQNEMTEHINDWCRIDAIKSFLNCFAFWWLVWINVIYDKIVDIIDNCDWLHSSSKL